MSTLSSLRITSQEIRTATDPGKDFWHPTNEILYDLCKTHPDHNSNSEIAAKVLLIGRSYAAAVERGVPHENGNVRDTTKFYRDRIATPIRRAAIDADVAKLRALSDISPQNADIVLSAHARLTEVLAQSIGIRKRSFVSKYLHFHAPNAVPIYDSLAVTSLSRHIPRVAVPDEWKMFDRPYADFVTRYLVLHASITRIHKRTLTPRQMDRLLWKLPI
jgi:hypothetical protein